MPIPTGANIVRLSDTDLTLAHPDEDVRGRKVVDAQGHEVGEVDDLMIDDQEKKVRFLRVATGGFLHIGRTKFLIPVDVIQSITPDTVRIDRTREHVAGAPAYDPEVTEEPDWQAYYAYYGASPFWAPGYMYPMYPYF
jgi:sporulation protein YlmC with PRC-barrel domain